MATSLTPLSSSDTVQVGVKIPSISTTTNTEFVGFDGEILKSTVDANGKPHRIHKVITTTVTVTCFGDDDLALKNDQTAEEKFVGHVKELGTDTKDVLLHTAANVQHALETAGDYIRTQLTTSSSSENTGTTTTTTTTGKDQTNLLQQASALKDVLVQKAVDIKDATVDAIKDLATPQEQTTSTAEFPQETATLPADKKNE